MSLIPSDGGGGGPTGPHRHRLRSKRRFSGAPRQQEDQTHTQQEARPIATMSNVDELQLASRLGHHHGGGGGGGGQCHSEENKTSWRGCNSRRPAQQLPPSSRFLFGCNRINQSIAATCCHMYSASRRRNPRPSRLLRRLASWSPSGLLSRPIDCVPLRLVTTIVLYLMLVLAATATSSHQQQLGPTSTSDQSATSIQLPGPSLWFQQQQLQRPPKSTAQLQDSPASQSSDLFGSRLASAASDARQSTPRAANREDAASPSAPGLDTAAATSDEDRVFMNRQGESASEPSRLRQARQPAPPAQQQQQRPNSNLLMQQQQQQRARQQLAGVAPPGGFANFPQQPPNNQDRGNQERFQRLRNNAGNFEQFPRPQQGNFGQQQQPGGFVGAPQPRQQQPQVALGLPTLSAFDLSSLANLANNQPANGGQLAQNQQLQPTFRRIPPPPATPQQQQQQQNQRANQQPPVPQNPTFPLSSQFFDLPTNSGGRQPVPNAPPGAQSTELPFIRQVFRPASENTVASGESPQSTTNNNNNNLFPAPAPNDQLTSLTNQFPARAPTSSGRPTPPPLFVPSRQQTGSGPQQSGLRTRPLESGFSPIQPNRSAQESPSQAAAAAFFEPSQQRGNSQITRQQQQPGLRQQQVAPQQLGSQQAASEPQQQQQRKPPVRRPSQRPHVPAAGPSTGVGGPMAGRVSATNAVAAAAAAQPDVIRLAANAIQAANEGLAAVVAASSGAPQSQQPPPATLDSTATTATSATTAAGSSELPPTTTTASAAEAAAQTSRRAISLQTPRASAATNFFQTLTSAATSAPSSFSPALPINQAIGATGGRRRIPVRVNLGQGGRPLTTTPSLPTLTPTTQPTTSGGRRPLAPLLTTTQASTSTSTTQAAVRRPEIEEFYETIGGGSMSSPGGGGPSTTTLIDGFGAPARPATTSSTSTASTSTTSTTNTPLGSDLDKSLATTTDLYGSRLSGGGGGGAGTSQLESSQPPATETSSRFPASESIDRPRLAVARPQPEVPVNLPETPLATSETEAQRPPPPVAQQQPVMVPVTYMTTLTYLTTVLHGTHTLETSHETVEKSTRMATLNAQLMDQIEHRLPLIEPTATVSLSSRTKGRGTTLVNLKSAISAYNQELVEALGAAGNGGQPPAPPIQPTQVMVGVQPTVTASQSPTDSQQQQQQQQTSNNANRQFQQLSFQRQGQAGKPQQRPSRTVDLKELAELKRQLYTEYVYSYTMRPVDQPDQVLATSVRSELVPGAGAMASADLASQLQAAAAAASGESNLIDANGMLRLVTAGSQNGGAGDAAQINLGSTIGRNTPQTMTEVNMNVATYLKFDGISNVLVDVRPTARFGPGEQAPAPAVPQVSAAASPTGGLSAKSQLDTSFNVHMTLGNALEQLAQQSPQQTPALEPTSVTSGAVNAAGNAIKISETTAAAGNELLRTDSASPSGGGSATSAAAAAMAMAAAAGAAVAAAGDTGAGNQAAASASAVSSSSLARSQLRSRVASSRFRTLQPSRAAAAAAVSASPVLTQASVSETAAPSISGLRQNLRPNKSRILRPSLLQRASSQQAASEISSSPIDSSSSSSSIVAPTTTRSSKPRFVVVTRTGQFGIRASAISSLAAASSSATTTTTTGSGESPSPVVDPSSVSSAPTVRVSSRFSKPNRFRGPSQSITRLAAEQIPVSATSVIPQPPVAPSQQQQEATQQPPPVSESSRKVDDGQDQRLVPPPQAANSIKLDGSDSVVVTYFTTTTHTIPFELNSETVFTTIEETNSRIATERMSDLNSRFIEPTATTSLPVIEQTAAPSMQPPVTTTTSSATTTTTSSSTSASQGSSTTSSPNEQTTTQQTSSTTTTTSGSEPSTSGATSLTSEQQQQQNRPVIDPSFVTSLNTRTYFTTFTHFTTYSAGTGSQTVESSESTTSNVVTETITETQPLSAQPPSSSQVVDPPADASSSVLQDSLPVTKTLLSTMTYYGTVYNGTQSSLTPILDVSTQVLTVSAGGDASTGLAYLNSNALGSSTATDQVAPTSVPNSTSLLAFDSSSLAPTPPLDSADKITRTKSMYTTLTHFITFYSGTKTQLSTIQEISPTVVTEYIDRTLFEQQQAEAASAGVSSSSPVLLIVPSATVAEPEVASASPTTTSTTTSTTTEQPETSANNQVSSSAESTSAGDQSGQQTTTSSTTTSTTSTSTTSQPELGAVSVSTPERPASAENQQQGSSEAKVLASSGTSDQAATGDLSIESKQATNIIELSDLIASNSSQSGRVALAGNLGAAIKDIVQLLAGNKTTAEGVGSRAGPLARPPVNLDNLPASSPASGGEPTTQTEAAPATTTTTTSTTANPPARRQNGTPTRVFGNKQRTSANIELSGSINSPATTSSSSTTNNSPPPAISFDDATTSSSGLGQRATPELPQVHQTGQPVNQRQAATIFFGDDSGDERKKQVKTVWPGVQSTVFVTSVEPSTRSLTVTTTKVYYTRDAPTTVTLSYTSVIAPRTFVSTIMGTRTLVNQLGGGSTQTALPANPAPAVAQPPRAADTQNAAVATRYKQQKQQQQQVATEQRKVNLELQAKQKQAELAKVAARTKLEQQQQQAAAMIAQCQPACKQSANEVCKFTPSLTEGGGVGTFACACRPGYYMSLNAVGQRACQEVQSYVVMLRLLQIGNEQVAYKRELQNRASPEFKQVAKIVREHVKRAYMTSDLIRDRFVGADILNFARTLSVSSGTASQSLGAQPNSGRAPLAINSSLLDPLNAGVIVNMTIHLQQQSSLSSSLSQPGGIDLQTSQQTVDESMLKEELTKKLNMRQAAALAAAAAQAASVGVAGEQAANTTTSSAGQTNNNTQADQPAAGANTGNGNQTSAHSEVESLPNPNALFLADVEHVQDLDECASPALNDCHEGAVCLNEPGSYRCDCREYPDLNPLQPGRQCAHELKSCDFCHNRGDCLRVPSLLSGAANSSSSNQHPLQPGNGRGQSFSTVCQCHRLFMGRHCEINGLLLSTLLPIVAILLIISVSLIIFCCRRWRRRSSLSKGFRNIGSFGPNIIGSTLDRKAMLESSSESSDTHQRHAHHHAHQAAAAAGHHHLNPHASPHGHVAAQLHHPPSAHLLRPGGGGGGLYDASEPSSSQESSPRQMSRGQLVDAGGPSQGSSLNPYHNSIPPQIVIPRARHNQVNYAVHRGQVYMW